MKLRLEQLEDRLTPSAMNMVQQEAQLIAAVQNEVSSIVRAITQDITQAEAYLLVRLDQILDIAPNPQNLSLIYPMPPSGNGTTITHLASNQQSSNGTQPVSNTTIKPLDSPGGPDVGGVGGYLWDPTIASNGVYLASNGENWDLNGESQVGAPNPTSPGNPALAVTFDPQATQAPGLHKNGAAPITWDYNAQFPQMNLGGLSAYTSEQTINANITVNVTGGVLANNTVNSLNSKLYLFFTAPAQGKSTQFGIGGNSTITNMKLAGAYQGNFIINGGTTNIAESPGYAETVGVNIFVNSGATLDDWSTNTLLYTNDKVQLVINKGGTMNVASGPNAANLLIDNGGNANDFINVYGGTLLYTGKGGVTDTIKMPIAVQQGGTFKVNGGKLIVQGTVPNQQASVAMTDAGSSVQLVLSGTLECDSGYSQSNGTLETMDSSASILQSGPANNLGQVNITGGALKIDQPNTTQYGTLNVTCTTLNFAGTYYPAINAKADVPGNYDLLYVNGTTNLLGASLYVWVNNTPPNNGSKWPIIQDNPKSNLIQNGEGPSGDGLPITTNPQTNLNNATDPQFPYQFVLSF